MQIRSTCAVHRPDMAPLEEAAAVTAKHAVDAVSIEVKDSPTTTPTADDPGALLRRHSPLYVSHLVLSAYILTGLQ